VDNDFVVLDGHNIGTTASPHMLNWLSTDNQEAVKESTPEEITFPEQITIEEPPIVY